MQELKGSRMGTEKIPKLMMELAIPSIIAQVINILYNIVDRMYIGHIPESITLFAFFVELKEKKQSRWLFQSQICRIWAS